ncbi:histidinol-phosphate transaminase [Anditalea andensis]|uniref:Histidinol-phosphate aminotransferase n=1 Tax=Anditalea andensis TaxID=1048983 RepID=A0A074KRA9_9BACT|nr:histidinol-phosphate transaminase [Anditalea andensis]KEO72486.1 histidinol phosphate aminotransferase [Anditalea andensis]
MSFSLDKILRPHIAYLQPYSSARDEYSGKEGVFLDANENPYGSLTEDAFNRYPDPYQLEIKQKLSLIKNIPSDQIFLGNGSDEAIDLLFRAFCIPGKDNVIILPPTYGMYEVSAGINDVMVKKVNLTADFHLRPKEIVEAIDDHTKIIFICSPNNPSGNSLKKDDIDYIIHHFNGLVVLDEAYIDFTTEASYIGKLDKLKNLMIIQTFSKAWGLASLRIGMAFASKEIIRIINRIKPPYNISGLTQVKVLEALAQADKKDEMVSRILKEKIFLEEQLAQLPIVLHIYPSDANFLLMKVTDAKKIYGFLIEDQIIIRDRSKVVLCEQCLRITVGTREENTTLLTSLSKYSNLNERP